MVCTCPRKREGNYPNPAHPCSRSWSSKSVWGSPHGSYHQPNQTTNNIGKNHQQHRPNQTKPPTILAKTTNNIDQTKPPTKLAKSTLKSSWPTPTMMIDIGRHDAEITALWVWSTMMVLMVLIRLDLPTLVSSRSQMTPSVMMRRTW